MMVSDFDCEQGPSTCGVLTPSRGQEVVPAAHAHYAPASATPFITVTENNPIFMQT